MKKYKEFSNVERRFQLYIQYLTASLRITNPPKGSIPAFSVIRSLSNTKGNMPRQGQLPLKFYIAANIAIKSHSTYIYY